MLVIQESGWQEKLGQNQNEFVNPLGVLTTIVIFSNGWNRHYVIVLKESHRRSIRCVDYNCNFLKWVKSPLCNFTQRIIPGLLRRIKDVEATNIELSQRMELRSGCFEYSRAITLLIVIWVLLWYSIGYDIIVWNFILLTLTLNFGKK